MRYRILLLPALACLVAAAPVQASPLVARVQLSTQTMEVIRDGEVIHTWPVSTARSGYVTPVGTWRPKRIHKMWHSRSYGMAPMPYAVFYDRGWAIHGTSAVGRLGKPASHGCVRLETDNAALFYALVEEIGAGNTRVIVEP